MAVTYYFYDLETSGINPREARPMQFAGQRTDQDLNLIGDPHNILISLPTDVLPDPEAILVTGITPQMTLSEGVNEAEFLKIFTNEIATENTVMIGYNSIRFDDEFMRYLHYRNFYDPYEWQWKDGRSRWDLLDVIRMTRALRPEGINWPVDSDNRPTNRLELITKLNGLDHAHAHDALSDVMATIAVAQLLRDKQPKLFEYLLSMRSKQKITEFVTNGQPFVYTSGRYPSEFEKTTVVAYVGDMPNRQGVFVYDLRHDPEQFIGKNPHELAEAMQWKKKENSLRIPVKGLQFNKCPAVAPLAVLEDASQQRIKIDLKTVRQNVQKLRNAKDFLRALSEAQDIVDKNRRSLFDNKDNVDAQLYDGFFDANDKTTMSAVRAAEPPVLSDLASNLRDARLRQLLPLYKARNFPQYLTEEERKTWDDYRKQKLWTDGQKSRLGVFFQKLSALAQQPGLSSDQQYLLEELQLYGQSVMPEEY